MSSSTPAEDLERSGPPGHPVSGRLVSTQPKPSDFVFSVGSKLASATILLILVVTAVVYVQLSRYQRENLLSAKELAGTALTRLFADSCAAPVVFNDDAAIEDALSVLSRNEDVEYAAVWSVESGNRAGRRLGEFARGAAEQVEYVPSSLVLRRDAQRVVLIAPVYDPAGQPVAVAIVALSFARENAAIKQVERRILLTSGSIALILAVLLMAVARLAIVRPLRKLAVAAKKLEVGVNVDFNLRTRDEIGQLASAFRRMANAIRNREDDIRSRNRDMRLVLDNVGQGFITLDLEARLSAERSRVVDEWFGTPPAGISFGQVLEPFDQAIARWFDVGWAAVRDAFLPLDVCFSQLPQLIRANDRTLELAYCPIMNGDCLDKAIVVITDITARIERERAERIQHMMMHIFQHILSDRAAFNDFFSEAAALVQAIQTPEHNDCQSLKRDVHTLKGNCALFGIETIATFCQELEDRLEESTKLTRTDTERLGALWSEVTTIRAQFSNAEGIELDSDDYRALVEDLRRGVSHDALLATVLCWRFEPAAKRLELLSEQAQLLAKRLGKGPVKVECNPTKLRLPSRTWSAFWAAFTHVVRNMVDHGIESPEARLSAGKPETTTIRLGISERRRHVVVTISDDGPGIDWPKVAERAAAHGLRHATRADLEEALFAQGVSTRSEVTDVSGRGVGLAAVRETVRTLGGTIEVQSERTVGTTFLFSLPLETLFEDEDARPTSIEPLPPARAASA